MALAKVRFTVTLAPSETGLSELPVDVRRRDLSLASAGLTSETMKVPAGHYFATAALPSGQNFTSEFDVEDGGDVSVVIGPEPDTFKSTSSSSQRIEDLMYGAVEQIVAPGSFDWSGTMALPTQKARESVIAATIGATRAASGAVVGSVRKWVKEVDQSRLRWIRGRQPWPAIQIFTGNPLAGNMSAVLSPGDHLEQVQTTLPGTTFKPKLPYGLSVVQLREQGRSPLNVLLATGVDSEDEFLITVRKLDDSTHTLDVHLRAENADGLLAFRRAGNLRAVASLTRSEALQAETLLQEKRRFPVAAAAGAYMLLLLGELDRLHQWTLNLMNWFPWLPDGLTVLAEHQALLGQHEEALSLLLRLPERGLPIFSDGLNIALARLELYQGLGREVGEGDAMAARALRNRLLLFASFVDSSRPFLTFRGLLPTQPSLTSAGHRYAVLEGFEVEPPKPSPWSGLNA